MDDFQCEQHIEEDRSYWDWLEQHLFEADFTYDEHPEVEIPEEEHLEDLPF